MSDRGTEHLIGPCRARDDWRSLMRRAMAITGHTQSSVAAARGVCREVIKSWLNGSKRLHEDTLEQMRACPDTADLVRVYRRLQAQREGWLVSEAQPDGLCQDGRRKRLTVELTDVLRTEGADLQEMREACDVLSQAIAALEQQQRVG